MHAYIISGSSIIDRNNRIKDLIDVWQINTFDLVNLETESNSIGIAEIRNIIPILNRKPQFSAYTVCIIHNGELLTIESQNALLKTLEEPTPHTRIIIETSAYDNLLPTIISRCQLQILQTKAAENVNPDILNLVNTILADSIGKNMFLLENAAKPWNNPTLYIYELFKAFHFILLEKVGIGKNSDLNQSTIKSVRQTALEIHKLIKVMRYLKANINPKIALDTLALP